MGEGSLLDCLDGLARRLVADEEGSTTRLERDLALEVRGWEREAFWTAWYAALWLIRRALPLVWSGTLPVLSLRYTVCKKDLILRSIQRRLQMQFSMARKFLL